MNSLCMSWCSAQLCLRSPGKRFGISEGGIWRNMPAEHVPVYFNDGSMNVVLRLHEYSTHLNYSTGVNRLHDYISNLDADSQRI